MRIEDVMVGGTAWARSVADMADEWGDGYGAERNALCPEVAVLLNAKMANSLFNCPLLARDEMEFANFIIDKLDIDPHYIPSVTLLQVIRSINAKLAISRDVRDR